MEKMDKIEIFYYIALPVLMLGATGIAIRYLLKLSGIFLESHNIEII